MNKDDFARCKKQHAQLMTLEDDASWASTWGGELVEDLEAAWAENSRMRREIAEMKERIKVLPLHWDEIYGDFWQLHDAQGSGYGLYQWANGKLPEQVRADAEPTEYPKKAGDGEG